MMAPRLSLPLDLSHLASDAGVYAPVVALVLHVLHALIKRLLRRLGRKERDVLDVLDEVEQAAQDGAGFLGSPTLVSIAMDELRQGFT